MCVLFRTNTSVKLNICKLCKLPFLQIQTNSTRWIEAHSLTAINKHFQMSFKMQQIITLKRSKAVFASVRRPHFESFYLIRVALAGTKLIAGIVMRVRALIQPDKHVFWNKDCLFIPKHTPETGARQGIVGVLIICPACLLLCIISGKTSAHLNAPCRPPVAGSSQKDREFVSTSLLKY